ncbi:MAG: site-specific integrase [Firmicutes bacterium]|jgi:integrase|nr:site-specific integrase [Bacillota bacterium]MCL5994417.1 site-specific integrase [Bacillota bacterium]
MSGHITQEGKGKWKITVEAGKDPATGKRKRIIKRIEGRRMDAQALMAQIVTELRQGTYIEQDNMSVEQWLNTWLHDYKKSSVRLTTWESYGMVIRLYLIPAVGALLLQDLRPDHLQKLYNEKQQNGFSARTIRYIHTIIHAALKQAVKNQLVFRNASEAVTLPKQEKSQVRAMTIDEQAKFLQVIQGDRIAAAFIILLATGLRRGELLGLRWRNVDLTLGRISVEENLVRTNTKSLQYHPPKTKKSKGQMPLNKSAIDAFKEHRKAMLAEGNCSPEKPVFCSLDGTPYTPRRFSYKFEVLRDKAKISKDITVHSTRHTFATRLLEAGVSMKEAQELLRHENIATTADIYSHVSVEMKQAAVDKLDQHLQSGTNWAPKPN